MMSAVGDAVHVLPLVTALKRHNPRSRITWILQPGPASLVRGHPDVDEIILFERKKGWRAFAGIRRELRNRRFDVVLSLQVYFKAGVITGFATAPVKLGFDRPRARDFNWLFTTHRIPARANQHVQEQYFEFLEVLGVPYEPVTWNLGPWPHEAKARREFLATLPRPTVTLVLATSNPQKDWIPERWAELVDVLYDDFRLRPVLAGGRSARELEIEATVMRLARHKPHSTLGVSLRELVWLIDASELVISPDTGPMHVAVALDTPVIGLMGYNNPKRIGPYRKFRDLMLDAYGDPGEVYPISMEHR
ncbi:MAG: glycosyltransferase family 9 protein, partial [Gemmatimonadota bacterium]|nr:glycosyltransferase family 9 protein [Gemmatimonadota bacterium]